MPFSRPATLLCAAALALMCTACAAVPPARSLNTPSDSAPSSVSDPDKPTPSLSAPETPALDEVCVPAIFVPESSAPKAPPSPTKKPEQTEQPTPEPSAPPVSDTEGGTPSQPQEETTQTIPTISVSAYDFSQPIPESEAVENGYFADAAFVGDSRSEGFYLYGVKRGKNLSASGLSVFNFAEKKVLTVGGTRRTALEALSLKEYAKVYLGFGVNELGYINADAFYRAYCDTIDAVRACQPQAVIYAQTMAPVNEKRVAAAGGAGHLNNDRVRLYNDLIRKAALEKQVPLLDVYSALAVAGTLPADASRDGVHLTGDYCRKQLEYLKTHTVSFDTLYLSPDTETEVPSHETSDIPAPESGAVPDAGADSLLPQPEQPPLPTDTD